MKKIYVLYYAYYEDNTEIRFTHPNNKLKAEFQQDCIDLMNKYIDEHIYRGGEVYDDDGYKTWIGTSTITELIASKLPELGYLPLNETTEEISFGFFGSDILDAHDSKKNATIYEYITAENKQKVIAYNEGMRA